MRPKPCVKFETLDIRDLDDVNGGGMYDFFNGVGQGAVLGGFARDVAPPVNSWQSWGQSVGHVGGYVGAVLTAQPELVAAMAARDTLAGAGHTASAIARGDMPAAAMGLGEMALSAAPFARPVAGALAELASPGASTAIPALAREAASALTPTGTAAAELIAAREGLRVESLAAHDAVLARQASLQSEYEAARAANAVTPELSAQVAASRNDVVRSAFDTPELAVSGTAKNPAATEFQEVLDATRQNGTLRVAENSTEQIGGFRPDRGQVNVFDEAAARPNILTDIDAAGTLGNGQRYWIESFAGNNPGKIGQFDRIEAAQSTLGGNFNTMLMVERPGGTQGIPGFMSAAEQRGFNVVTNADEAQALLSRWGAPTSTNEVTGWPSAAAPAASNTFWPNAADSAAGTNGGSYSTADILNGMGSSNGSSAGYSGQNEMETANQAYTAPSNSGYSGQNEMETANETYTAPSNNGYSGQNEMETANETYTAPAADTSYSEPSTDTSYSGGFE